MAFGAFTCLYPRLIFLLTDSFINMKICYRCYKYDDHKTAQCPQEREYKICSHCASNEHTFGDCKSSIKLCLNCNGEYSTLSFSCPYRKNIIKNMKARNSASTSTYASAAAKQSPQGVVSSLVQNDSIVAASVKSFMCMVLAGAKNIEKPGSFGAVLDELLEVNKIPALKLGNVVPPDPSALAQFMGPTVKSMQTTVSTESDSVNTGTKLLPTVVQESRESPCKKSFDNSDLEGIKIYRRKGTPTLTPENVCDLHDSGSILLESERGNASCLKALTRNCDSVRVFLRDVTELKNKDYDARHSERNKRRTRTNTASGLADKTHD